MEIRRIQQIEVKKLASSKQHSKEIKFLYCIAIFGFAKKIFNFSKDFCQDFNAKDLEQVSFRVSIFG